MKKIILLLMILIFSGCSKVLLPYEEEPRCKPNNNYGDCGSVSSSYKQIHEDKNRSVK